MDLERERILEIIKSRIKIEEEKRGRKILKTEEDFQKAVRRLEPFIRALEELKFFKQVFNRKPLWHWERMSFEDMVHLTKTASKALGLDSAGRQFALIQHEFITNVGYVEYEGQEMHVKEYILNHDLITKTFQWCLATIEDERRELC